VKNTLRTTTLPSIRLASEQIANALAPPPEGSTLVMTECTYGR
jgi:hypothetical protein